MLRLVFLKCLIVKCSSAGCWCWAWAERQPDRRVAARREHQLFSGRYLQLHEDEKRQVPTEDLFQTTDHLMDLADRLQIDEIVVAPDDVARLSRRAGFRM